MIVTIDGPAGAGKSTVARMLAQRVGFQYLDSGAIYRCYAFQAWKTGLDLENPGNLEDFLKKTDVKADFHSESPRLWVDGLEVTEEIRSSLVSGLVSRISSFGEVRNAVVQKLRDLARIGDYVIDGRDIGTVVFPDAGLKVFLTASLEERAKRRSLDLQEQGEVVDMEKLKQQISQRDLEDSTREIAPLRKPGDAVEIDTTGISREQVLERMSQMVDELMQVSKKI